MSEETYRKYIELGPDALPMEKTLAARLALGAMATAQREILERLDALEG